VLPVAIGDATKTLQALLSSGKEYVCVMQLHKPVAEDQIRSVMDEFTDRIYQRPPLRSSVKRLTRVRTIHYLDLLETVQNKVLFKVGCESGTYIRKLCFDLGEALGRGAHMKELRRTRTGPFIEEDSTVLHDLVDAHAAWLEEGDEVLLRRMIQPMESCLKLLPKVYVRDSAVDAICHGADLALPGILKFTSGIRPRDQVAILTLKDEAVALGKSLLSSEDMERMEHGLAVKTRRVIMDAGMYPRLWRKRQKR